MPWRSFLNVAHPNDLFRPTHIFLSFVNCFKYCMLKEYQYSDLCTPYFQKTPFKTKQNNCRYIISPHHIIRYFVLILCLIIDFGLMLSYSSLLVKIVNIMLTSNIKKNSDLHYYNLYGLLFIGMLMASQISLIRFVTIHGNRLLTLETDLYTPVLVNIIVRFHCVMMCYCDQVLPWLLILMIIEFYIGSS